jgi:hypothetical protein
LFAGDVTADEKQPGYHQGNRAPRVNR